MPDMPLKTKGLVAFLALVLYAIGLVAFVLYEKQVLIDEVDQLRASYDRDGVTEQINLATLRVLLNLHTQIAVHDNTFSTESLRKQLTVLRTVYAGVPERYPVPEPALTALQVALDNAYVRPSMGGWQVLRDRLAEARTVIGMRLNNLEQHQRGIVEGFRARSDNVALVALLTGLLGITIIGWGGGLFLTRMSRDLQTLSERTGEIIKRDTEVDIPVQRSDEVGILSRAMSEMAVALRDRERAEELERQQYFHQEKMSAIGTLASGIMHEIGNPVMAISGLVHELQTQDRDTAGPNGLSDTRYGQILQQLERVTAILGDVSEFTMPLPLEREVLDLNVLIDSAYRMLRFDRRLAKIGCIRELDHALPAISGITDHLSQVVMSLLLNALDAVESLEDRAPIIMIRTRPAGEQVELTVQDNGCGMDSDTRRQAFDAFFTSKAEGKGSGLGLTLCQSIVDEHDGAIELDSVQDVGTTVRILLPALAETENEHLF